MKTVANTKRIKRGRFIATTTSLAGLSMLIFATLAPVLAPQLNASPLPSLIMGVILALIGIQLSNQWLKTPTPHEALDSALKGFSKKAVLYHYWLPAKHVLICSHGVFSLTTRPQEITAIVKSEDWETKENLLRQLRRLLTRNTLGNPLRDALRDAQSTQAWIDQNLPGHQIAVKPIIVFTNPKTSIQVIEQPNIPVTYADKRKPSLKTHIRDYINPTLSQEEIAQIETVLKIPQ